MRLGRCGLCLLSTENLFTFRPAPSTLLPFSFTFSADLIPSRYSEPFQRYADAQLAVHDSTVTKDRTYDRDFQTLGGPTASFSTERNLDQVESRYRQDTRPLIAENRFGSSRYESQQERSRFGGATADLPVRGVSGSFEQTRTQSTVDPPCSPSQVRVEKTTTRTTVDPPRKHRRDMGYYDDEGHYHSFRRGVQRVAERIAHPIHGPSLRSHHHHTHKPHYGHHEDQVREDTIIQEREISIPQAANGSYSASSASYSSGAHRPAPRSSMYPNTVTIPCHHIRIGDLLILQGRPCQVIRISTSSQTGQHRYLGVDLFTKQLHEESSFISNPSPSVVVQNMLGPVFKQYRVLDIRDDGCVVAMTETGDIKQALPVLDQSNLMNRLTDAFDNGRGSVRILVLSDDGRELAVDYKVVHGSRL